MSKDNFSGRAASMTDPSGTLRPVTPDDMHDLPEGITRAIFVTGAGTLAVVDTTGVAVSLASSDQQYHPVRIARVLATGTSATGIVALY